MPLYDFSCECGNIFETFAAHADRTKHCPICNKPARRIVSLGRSAWRHDAPWVESVLEVVDKESRDPATRAFLETPTRENYRRWMKANGLRPMDENEKPTRVDDHDLERHLTERLMQRKKRREAIELHG
jgi:putative FmdB family regulatory protein